MIPPAASQGKRFSERLKKRENKKAAFYTPYIHEMGGGERYLLAIIEYFRSQGFKIDLWVGSNVEPEQTRISLQRRLGFNLDGVRIIPDHRPEWLRQLGFYPLEFLFYKIVFCMVNTLPLISLNFNSVMIVQFPCDGPAKRRPFRRYLKWFFLRHYRFLLVYSQYTAEWVGKYWHETAEILYPPCKSFLEGPKKNIILTVGRFSEFKKQKEMIECFKTMVDQGLKNWEFHLLGGLTDAGDEYFSSLKESSQNYPIFLASNLDKEDLATSYSHAKIYWHAAGFNEDTDANPHFAEHFGMTTVEAMSAGCVPVVIRKGGQPEIVKHDECGFLWQTKEELIMSTRRVMDDEILRSRLSAKAIERSKVFNEKIFAEQLEVLMDKGKLRNEPL